MNIYDALIEARKYNVAICRSSFPDDCYIYHGMDNLLVFHDDSGVESPLTPSVAAFLALDWQLDFNHPYHGKLDNDKDEIYSVTMIMNAKTFGETLKEKFEAIYIKLLESHSILSHKFEIKTQTNKINVYVGKYIKQLFDASTTTGRSLDDSFMLHTYDNDVYHINYDEDMPPNELIVEYNGEKAHLKVVGFEI